MLFCPYLNLTYERDRIQLNSPTSLKISFCYRPLCFCLSGPGFPSSFVESLFLLVAPCGWWGPKVGPQPSAFLVLCAVWGDLTESLVAATSLWPVPIWAPGLDLKLSRSLQAPWTQHAQLQVCHRPFQTHFWARRRQAHCSLPLKPGTSSSSSLYSFSAVLLVIKADSEYFPSLFFAPSHILTCTNSVPLTISPRDPCIRLPAIFFRSQDLSPSNSSSSEHPHSFPKCKSYLILP